MQHALVRLTASMSFEVSSDCCRTICTTLQVPPATLASLLRELQMLVDGGRDKLLDKDEQARGCVLEM